MEATYSWYDQKEINKLQSIVTVELVILFFIGIVFFGQQTISLHSQTLAYEHSLTPLSTVENAAVLGASTEITPTLPTPQPNIEGRDPDLPDVKSGSVGTTPSPTPTSEPTPTVNQSLKTAKKSSYSIAVYGDSMVDTMGERLEYLEHSLKKIYPNVNFTLYNYGKGSENVEMGLNRWNNKLDYQDRHYPSIVDLKPDIIVMGSFAYNPFSPYIRDRHWVGLTKTIEAAKIITPNVYVLAEINPLRKTFGKGPNGVNWEESTAYEHSGHIVEQLENAVGLARTLNVPLIDVFHQSIGVSGLNNSGDGIHASVAGHEFTADIIAKTIDLN